MSKNSQSGQVQTVLGQISPATVGLTTTHEHLLIDFTCMFKPPTTASDRLRAYEPVKMENLGWVGYDPFRNYDNLQLIDEQVAATEASLFKKAGGGTIVDVTTVGIGRDPLALARIARVTGLNIVTGAGYYVDIVHPDDMNQKSDSDIANEMVADLTKGIGNTGIKAGIIGELGCSWPLTDNERKVLRAAAIAQQATGSAILIHPGRNDSAPFEILDVLKDSGADISRVVIGHLDRTIFDEPTLLKLAEQGCVLEYDLFGWETSYYPLSNRDMITDAQRLEYIKFLVDEGYEEKIVVGQDIFAKYRLVTYGGLGYAHLIENIIPRMHDNGLSDDSISSIFIENPKRILTFV